MIKIAIVYICTGNYSIFWRDFFSTSERFFFYGNDKDYFVFTDDDQIRNEKNITVIRRIAKGFPLDSLMRFEMFLQIENQLKKFDYIFFFNSNMVFVKPVGAEILPDKYNSELTGVIHPGYFNKSPLWFPYERNKSSYAYITYNKGKHFYYMGCLLGGSSKAFIDLCRCCDDWTKSDLSKCIMPVYHDESYLNKYFSDKAILQLDPGYAYPEGWEIPFDSKIILRNKTTYGGGYFNKLAGQTLFSRIKKRLLRFTEGVLWYLNR